MSLQFHVDTKDFDLPGLDRLAELDRAELLDGLGALGVSQTQRRISSEKSSPDGDAWAPLHPAYAASKKGGGILEKEGHLLGSITAEVQGLSEVGWGSNLVYAAIHQKGGTIKPKNADRLAFVLGGTMVFAREVTIPARPFLGISGQNAAEIEVFSLQFIKDLL